MDECQYSHSALCLCARLLISHDAGLLPMDAKGKDVDDEKLMIRDNVRSSLY